MTLNSSLKRRQVSLEQQQHIRQLRAHGMSIQAIADLTGIGKSSIQRMVPPSPTGTFCTVVTDTTIDYDKFKGLSWLDFWQMLGPPLNKQGEQPIQTSIIIQIRCSNQERTK